MYWLSDELHIPFSRNILFLQVVLSDLKLTTAIGIESSSMIHGLPSLDAPHLYMLTTPWWLGVCTLPASAPRHVDNNQLTGTLSLELSALTSLNCLCVARGIHRQGALQATQGDAHKGPELQLVLIAAISQHISHPWILLPLILVYWTTLKVLV